MKEWLMEQYKDMISSYWDELKGSDVKGKYNSVFRTYSTTQRDVQMKYKTLFSTLFAMAEKFKVDLEQPNPAELTVIDDERDEVLG